MSAACPPYITSPLLDQFDTIGHGFFGAEGGVSSGIYNSLNCAHSSADQSASVAENRSRVAQCFGLRSEDLYSLKQAHTCRVIEINQNLTPQFAQRADAMVSVASGVGLGVLGADCAPVLFVDPVKRVIGAAHSGWKGALDGVNEALISAMCDLGADLQNIYVAIGPAMQAQHYQVQDDFRQRFAAQSPIDSDNFFRVRSEQLYFDTPGYIQARLRAAGIAHIHCSDEDTFTQPHKYFSYRRACRTGESDYGRQPGVITLKA